MFDSEEHVAITVEITLHTEPPNPPPPLID